jgi:hypothetical protein
MAASQSSPFGPRRRWWTSQRAADRVAPRIEAFGERALPSGTLPAAFGPARDAPRQELVVIDPSIPEASALARQLHEQAAAGRSVDVLLLAPDRDGLDQVAEALAAGRPLDAVHIATHGNASGIQLGLTWLDARVILDRAESVAGWSDGLKPHANLLLYGGDLEAGHDGRHLLEALRTLTGAEVASRLDRTGAGGDWRLEFSRGAVTTPPVFTTGLLADGTFALFQAVSAADNGASTSRDASPLTIATPPSNPGGVQRHQAFPFAFAPGRAAHGLRIYAPSVVTIHGSGSEDVWVVLLGEPLAPVTLRLATTAATELVTEPATLTFTAENWSVPRRVRLRGVSRVADGRTVPAAVVVTTSGDPAYEGLSAILPVRVVHSPARPADPLVFAVRPPAVPTPADAAGGWLVDEVILATGMGVNVPPAPPLRLPNGSGSTDGEADDDAVAGESAPSSAGSNANQLAPKDGAGADRAVDAWQPMLRAGNPAAALAMYANTETSRLLAHELAQLERRRSALSGVTVGTAAVASVGFVLWSLRGAARLGGLAASPSQTWVALDPLVLLARRRGRRDDEVSAGAADNSELDGGSSRRTPP